MTKKKQEYREWVRLVDFKKVNGILVKSVLYIHPLPQPRPYPYSAGGGPPKQLPLAPRPENTAAIASVDETAAYEVGEQAGRKGVLETVRDMSSSALKGMWEQRGAVPHRMGLPSVGEHLIIV